MRTAHRLTRIVCHSYVCCGVLLVLCNTNLASAQNALLQHVASLQHVAHVVGLQFRGDGRLEESLMTVGVELVANLHVHLLHAMLAQILEKNRARHLHTSVDSSNGAVLLQVGMGQLLEGLDTALQGVGDVKHVLGEGLDTKVASLLNVLATDAANVFSLSSLVQNILLELRNALLGLLQLLLEGLDLLRLLAWRWQVNLGLSLLGILAGKAAGDDWGENSELARQATNGEAAHLVIEKRS